MPDADPLRQAFEHYEAGRLSEAARICRDRLAQRPDEVAVHFLLAAIAAVAGRDGEAEGRFRSVLLLAPDIADAYANIAVLTLRRHDAAAALRAARRALRLDPVHTGALLSRADARSSLGDRKGALADLAALRCVQGLTAPTTARLGTLLREGGRLLPALAAHRAALALEPGRAEGWRDLGHDLRCLGRPVEAARAYGRACRLDPNGDALSDLFFARRSLCEWCDDGALERALTSRVDTDECVVLPLAALLLDLDPTRQDRAARLFSRSIVGAVEPWSPRPLRGAAGGRLTIAYLSADFHQHATAHLSAELFERHDRARVRVLAYSTGPDDSSPMRRRLMASFDRFRDVAALDAVQVGALADEDEVDILVDLKGYTEHARLDLLRRRLAPLQVSWLGYPGPLGSAAHDYLIGDAVVTPPDHQAWYGERLVRLPDSYQVNDRRRPRGADAPDRASLGLPRDAVVFGALGAPHKIGPALFDLWMRILRAVPDAVLWLFAPHPSIAANLRREAGARGVDPDRLRFAAPRPQDAHIARLAAADLALDTFPYNGHTTTSDALWAGVPVVTCLGRGFAARVAASLAAAAGLPDLVADTPEGYERLAIDLARAPRRLAAIRHRLGTGRATCPLFDSARFARHLEEAYALMAERQRAGLAPAPFDVACRPMGRPAPRP